MRIDAPENAASDDTSTAAAQPDVERGVQDFFGEVHKLKQAVEHLEATARSLRAIRHKSGFRVVR